MLTISKARRKNGQIPKHTTVNRQKHCTGENALCGKINSMLKTKLRQINGESKPQPQLLRTNLQLGSTAVLMCLSIVLSTAAQEKEEVLKSEYGAPLKIVIRNDTAIFEQPDIESNSKPVKQFAFLYVLASGKNNILMKNGFYRVSSTPVNAREVGWVKGSDAVVWPHNQVLGFKQANATRRQPSHFFATKKLAIDHLQNDNESTRQAALSREPVGKDTFSLLPILEQFDVDNAGGTVKGYRVAYLHCTNVFGNESLTTQSLKNKLKLDIAFVIDTTASMGPYIDHTKKAVETISRGLKDNQDLASNVRFALIGFRDKDATYTSKVLCDFEKGTNIDSFIHSLREVVAAEGGDDSEQVFYGVKTAITDLKWGDVATRHIVLIGDNPNHEPDHGPESKSMETLAHVLALARPVVSANDIRGRLRRTTIHTYLVGEDPQTKPSAPAVINKEKEKLRIAATTQFAKLSQDNQNSGYSEIFDGSGKFEKKLTEMLTRRVDDLRMVREGNIDEVKNSKGAGELKAVLDYLGKDPLPNPTFAEGFAMETDPNLNTTLEPYVMITKNELTGFITAVDFMANSFKRSRDRDLGGILDQIKIVATDAQYPNLDENTTPAQILSSLLQGLPVKAKIFNESFKTINAKNAGEFNNWVKEIDESTTKLRARLTTTRWFSPGSDVMDDYLAHTFILVDELP
jgi:hypothetical protein